MSIKSISKQAKLNLVKKIEETLTATLFAELVEDTTKVAGDNALATLGIQETIGIIYQGIRYHPTEIKPLGDLGTYLPMNKSMSADFSKYLTKHRDTLNAFSIVRNMLLKAVATANTPNELIKLTTLPRTVIDEALTSTQYPPPKHSLSQEDIDSFKITHKKAIDAIEYYATFTQLFGDIEEE